MPGRLHDTYAAALQHDLVEVPDGAALLGVVRRQTRWFGPYVDENLSALGPPEDLLEDFRDRREALTADGVEEAEAHNRAWDAVDYDERYREHLATSDAAQDALDRIHSLLDDGTDVVLVCYENTDEKRCHRTLLLDHFDD